MLLDFGMSNRDLIVTNTSLLCGITFHLVRKERWKEGRDGEGRERGDRKEQERKDVAGWEGRW